MQSVAAYVCVLPKLRNAMRGCNSTQFGRLHHPGEQKRVRDADEVPQNQNAKPVQQDQDQSDDDDETDDDGPLNLWESDPWRSSSTNVIYSQFKLYTHNATED